MPRGTARYLTVACADRFVYLWDIPSGVLLERHGTRSLFDQLITPSARRQQPLPEELRDRYLPWRAGVRDCGGADDA